LDQISLYCKKRLQWGGGEHTQAVHVFGLRTAQKVGSVSCSLFSWLGVNPKAEPGCFQVRSLLASPLAQWRQPELGSDPSKAELCQQSTLCQCRYEQRKRHLCLGSLFHSRKLEVALSATARLYC